VRKACKFVILFFLVFVYNKGYGQDSRLGSWNILNLKLRINDKLSVFSEFQIRSLGFYSNFHYYEYKAGAAYQIHPNINLALGAGDYNTYKEGGNFITPMNNDEFRIWPQFTLTQSIGNFKIEHRYRAELRFTSLGYRNRFRYRLGLSLPFGIEKDGYKPFTISFSDELFFTDAEPHFERNRVLFSFSIRFSKQIAMQTGYIKQFDYKINDETGRDFLLLGINIELSKKGHPQELKSND